MPSEYRPFLLPLIGSSEEMKTSSALAEEAVIDQLVARGDADWNRLLDRLEDRLGLVPSTSSPRELNSWSLDSVKRTDPRWCSVLFLTSPQGERLKAACHPDVWKYHPELATEKLLYLRPSQFERFFRQSEGSTSTLLTEKEKSIPSLKLPTWLDRAAKGSPSDLHWLPKEKEYHLCSRRHGVWTREDRYSREEAQRILQQTKSLAQLPLERHPYPLEGRLRRDPWDLRLSFIPSHHGEALTIRLLPLEDPFTSTRSLGWPKEAGGKILQSFQIPGGLTLICGPTGSGKSTTLKTCLRLSKPQSYRMVTLEDPVERVIPFVHQIEVRETTGEAWQRLLRNLLRQAPDYLSIGEIRDPDTAQLVASASLTGHRLSATMHADSLSTVRDRLQDLGLSIALQSEILNLVIVQRWVQASDRDLPSLQFSVWSKATEGKNAWAKAEGSLEPSLRFIRREFPL